MRHTAIALIIAALSLSACYNSKPTETSTEEETHDTVATAAQPQPTEQVTYADADARMHGLLGKVSHVSATIYRTYEDGSQLKEGSEYKSYALHFDKWGHVTKDLWQNEYGYDAEGNYYRGNHTYTKLERDKQGRIVRYIDEEPATDSESNCTYQFSYGKGGQLIAVRLSGWVSVWKDTITYASSIFPETTTRNVAFEGEEGMTITATSYRYNSKDAHGNWTDRTCIVVEQTTATEYDEETQQTKENTESDTAVYIEKRVIEYYE